MENQEAYKDRLLKELNRILLNDLIPQDVKDSLLAKPEVRELVESADKGDRNVSR